ncbi:MAG: Type 1 glutamine amidotransferase-like domain-containing protein, partial [Gemmataceae bacterium]
AEAAGGAKARVVVIPASADLEAWKSFKFANLSAVKLEGAPAALKAATAVWFDTAVEANADFDAELLALLQRGGIVGGQLPRGLDLLPDVVFGDKPEPGQVGLALEPGAALLVRGRDLKALGTGHASISLALSPSRPVRTVTLKPGDVADYTTFRRAARERATADYPPKELRPPEVPSGALVIVGGGGMPPDISRKFVELAGGKNAFIVVLPTSMPDPIPPGIEGGFFQRFGAGHVQALKARELKDVEAPESLELLKKATGIWFDGGRQWRFIDAYEGTKAEGLFRDVLRRGGVIGGSSAGASIQGDYLCRGDPLGPNPIICEGYERGLGFLPGVAIDQHFTQRKRQPDMTKLTNTYPQFLGLGLDEATAVVVKGQVAEVMGRGKAHFYDRRKPLADGKPDYEQVSAGGRYDLQARKILAPAIASAPPLDLFLGGLPARGIGPANMGGRIVDIAAVESDPKTIFIASASGGVWKTTSGGESWTPLFDFQPTGVIGAIAVCQSNPNIVWVGTGEANPRNSVSWGEGVFKSADGGRTWQHMGLKETRHIGRVVIHAKNPDIVYVAALGHLWGPNKGRGLYKTADGGKSWKLVKFLDENTGIIDVAIDPAESETLYCASYCVRRDGFAAGNPATQTGPNTGLFKSTDGGANWTKMTAGLPDRPLGRCGLAVYRKDPRIVYAVVQTDKTDVGVRGQPAKEGGDPETGGVFRSDDKGATWKKVNDLCSRPFYYGQVRIDPANDQRIYVLGISFHISDDGGKTFPAGVSGRGPHPDNHALWIDPANPDRLLLGTDGGLFTSTTKAKSWEPLRNLPIGQFYGVAVDSRKPFRVYGGLQDNGSWGGPVATRRTEGITPGDWRRVAGGDGFQCAVDPTDPDTVYAEGQWGRLQRIALKGEKSTSKSIQPKAEKGAPGYRFNWESPIVVSPHDAKTLYFGGNFVFKSTDRGDTWAAISPDLTHGQPGPSASTGHTITALAESPKRAGLLWAGSDDGRLHMTTDGGKTWADVGVNLPDLPAARWVTRVECSPFDAGTAYVAIDRHRNDDLRPYLFQTTDFGKTWKSLAAGLPPDEPVNVVRQSSKSRNLLFAGTQKGLYVSIDGGAEWRRHRQGLPTMPVHDLVIHPRDRELVIATHGRSLFVLDIAPLEELTPEVLKSDVYLFALKPATVFEPRKPESPLPARTFKAPNPPLGATVYCYLRSAPDQPATLTVTDAAGKLVATLPPIREAGMHRAVWNLRGDGTNAPLVAAGEYTLTLRASQQALTQKVRVEAGP